VLPRLPKHSGDRNRTSPFAFTGNKFEFRALGAAQSPALANTVLNTIVADAIDDLARAAAAWTEAGDDVEAAVREVIADTYRRHGRIVFNGDGYSDEWEREAQERGLLNLRTTPDALPELVSDATVRVFAEQSVLSARELHARYDVLLEQYATKLGIEGQTAAQMARGRILPAVLRQRELIENARGPLLCELRTELDAPARGLYAAIGALEAALAGVPEEPLERALYMRDAVMGAAQEVRADADRLERLVADDLWPLATYAEMLFIR
jgi:glutamine synthetase